MREIWDREKHAQFNKENRLDAFKQLAVWAAIGGIGPVSAFLNHNILHTPQPIGRTFTGFYHEPAPMGDYYETYDYQFASSTDHALSVMGFVLGIVAAIAVALLFYCIARFLADPIMYHIDMHTKEHSSLQLWLKRIVMTLVVLLYCGSMVFAAEYEMYPDEQYIWLSDGQGHEIRVSKEEFEKYSNKDQAQCKKDNESDTDKSEAEESAKKVMTKEKEDFSKTPVERGYPSNDLDYYINHPDEPMPQEIINELTAPDSFNP